MKRNVLLFYMIMIFLTRELLQASNVRGDTFDCLIKPYVVVNISSAVEGVLDMVTVDRGDLVKQGQILARLESGAEQAGVARFRARATLEAPIQINQARLKLSARQHLRSVGLHRKALIPEDEMDEAETTKRLAELDLLDAMENQRLAELDLKRAMAELSRRTIKSPITGVVVERLRHPGEFANENPILTLAQIHPLRVDVFVPVALLGQVGVETQAEVMPEPPVSGVYQARVTSVDRVIDAASGMFGVRLELPNRDYRLPAGLKCQIRFQLQPTDWTQTPGPPHLPSAPSHPSPPTQWTQETNSQRLPPSQGHLAAPSEQAEEPDAQSLPAAPSRPLPIVGNVKQGETASELFVRAGIGMAQIITLQRAILSVYDIQLLRVGRPYSIQLTPDGELQHFTYDIDARHRLEVERHQKTFVGHIQPISDEPHERLVSARIVGSVYATLLNQGENRRLARDVVDVFAQNADVLSDAQQENTLCLLIEERSRGGKASRYNRMLAAAWMNGGQSLQAVYYEQGQTEGYYQPDGRTLQGSPLSKAELTAFLAHSERLLPKLAPCQAAPAPHAGGFQAQLDRSLTE